MITEKELQEAIAECLRQKNPNANTCLKLAAYYTILNNIASDTEGYSLKGESEFLKLAAGKDHDYVMAVIDGLMNKLQVISPRLYDSTIKALKKGGS